LTVALWAFSVAILLRVKTRIERQRVDRGSPRFLDHLGDLFRSLGAPAITLSVLALVAYLALVPSVVDAVAQNFQAEIAFARQPDGHWSKVESAAQNVRADIDLMKVLRQEAEVEFGVPQEDEQ
jgi:hypothetical protein